MIKQELFDGKVEIGISEIVDGKMRFFGEGDEVEIIKNQEKLGRVLGLNGERVARVRTVYDGREEYVDYQEIVPEDLPKYTVLNPEKQIAVSDGLVTKSFDIGILLPLADCIGAVVFDEEHEVLGLLHAGRQNIEQEGPKRFIEFLVRKFNSEPGKLKMYFSPHAVNYQIQKLDNKTMPEAAKEQLINAGVLLENIIDPGIDTVSSENFPSNSGGDKTQRFAVVVRRVDNSGGNNLND